MKRVTPWILVAEDDANARNGLLELLTDAGFDVCAAANGQEALDLLEAGSSPGLMLVDLAMPRVTGWEFLKYIHEDPALRLIPTIVITAAAEQSDLVADEVFIKPLDVPRLLASVRRLFGQGDGQSTGR